MSGPYRLFERFGVELEYMIVDHQTLAVRPLADEVLRTIAGRYTSDVDVDGLTWSNELVLHVIELKTTAPARQLEGLAGGFQGGITRINDLLLPQNARLLPAAMHPWMNPATDTRLWPHDGGEIYQAFDRIFNCEGHGWSNLQCVHLNLPFAGDTEFGRLHAAVRLLLPLLPALAASSPIVEGQLTGVMDTRLEVYRSNARRIPSVTGRVVPEPVFTQREYEEQILGRIYADLAPFDTEGVLQHEWANARGAIARFDRSTIEIRLIDVQECPQADLAVLRLIVAVLRALIDERWCSNDEQRAWPVEPLEDVLLATIRDADEAVIRNAAYLRLWGIVDSESCTARELWRHLLDALSPPGPARPADLEPLETILTEGCLARRLARAVGNDPDRARLQAVYGELSACLAAGRLFQA